MAEPQKLPAHVEQVGEDEYVCRDCHGGVGPDGFALVLDAEPAEEAAEMPAEEAPTEAAFADAIRGMP